MTIYFTPWLVGDLERSVRRVRYWLSDNVPLLSEFLTERYFAPTPEQIAEWRARGHEFTIHPYVEGGVREGFNKYWREFTGRGYGPVSPTVRTHRILWDGWVETAEIQASYGIRMNMDYYHWGPPFKNIDGEWVWGYFTGSGLPMKFVNERGQIINIYQQLTELADDHMVAYGWEWDGPVMFTPEEAVEVARTMLRKSVEGAYSAIVVQAHVDPIAEGGKYAETARQYLEGILRAASEFDIPILSAEEWLKFTEVRHNAQIEDVQWDSASKRFSFLLSVEVGPDSELSIMLPIGHDGATLRTIEVDGRAFDFAEQTVGGVIYGLVHLHVASSRVTAIYQSAQ